MKRERAARRWRLGQGWQASNGDVKEEGNSNSDKGGEQTTAPAIKRQQQQQQGWLGMKRALATVARAMAKAGRVAGKQQ
jgi:hypothetical protein